LFQKALILGLLNKNEEKINALRILENNYSGSTYIDEAVYEIADNYLKNESYDLAASAFQNLIAKYPRSVFLRQAILNKVPFEKNVINYCKDGSLYKCHIKGFPIFNNKGEVTNFIAFEKIAA
jgi:predicted Zn-dependent protease